MAGILYLVATPIGNYEDMTFRAVNVLSSVDLVVYEERKEGERLLRRFDIQKPVSALTEHNEQAATHALLQHLGNGKSIALVSDAGTPVFSDPGRLLVQEAIKNGIRLVPVQQEKRTIVLMDTPYRLIPLLRDLAETFGDTRRVCLAFELTMPDEKMFYGTATELYRLLAPRKLKGEFVLTIEGRGRDPRG
jgi:16S rRNA (cytidine1402-2'-O)-methyltransferase